MCRGESVGRPAAPRLHQQPCFWRRSSPALPIGCICGLQQLQEARGMHPLACGGGACRDSGCSLAWFPLLSRCSKVLENFKPQTRVIVLTVRAKPLVSRRLQVGVGAMLVPTRMPDMKWRFWTCRKSAGSLLSMADICLGHAHH